MVLQSSLQGLSRTRSDLLARSVRLHCEVPRLPVIVGGGAVRAYVVVGFDGDSE
mgnify:CR=1 FL=1